MYTNNLILNIPLFEIGGFFFYDLFILLHIVNCYDHILQICPGKTDAKAVF